MAGGAGLVLGLVGTAVSAIGTIAAGNAQNAMAQYQAKVYDIKAKEEKAAGQREGMEYLRRLKLAEGKLKTSAAASGLGATDPTILNLAGDIGAYGTLQQQYAQYGGESRAQGFYEQAALARAEGASAKQGAALGAFGTIIGGVGSMFKNYGGGGFLGDSSPQYGAAQGYFV